LEFKPGTFLGLSIIANLINSVTNKLKEVHMKALKCVLALFAFVGLMLAGCSDQSQSPLSVDDQSAASLQKNIIRSFTSEEGPNLADPGLVVPDPKIADGKTIFKGIKLNTYFEATFPDGGADLLSGNGKLELNSIIDNTTGAGFTWGKLTITPTNPAANGGVWEISWHGNGYIDPSTGMSITPLKWVGHGKGGAVHGMQFRCDDTIYMTSLLDWVGKDGENNFIKEH